MRHLILIKHSLPTIEPTLPAQQWPLSSEGHRRCHALATQLLGYTPSLIAASPELKAQQTAAHLSQIFGLLYHSIEGLHEHQRSFLTTTTDFEQIMDTFFSQPDKIVFGSESARQARERFTIAVTQAISEAATDDVFIVAHGTVITLFVSYYTKQAAFSLWQSLDLPSFIVLSLPDYRLIKIMPHVGA